MEYDGVAPLSTAIATLFKLSPKSHSQIALKIKEAMDALGITSKSKQLPNDVKLSIFEWQRDKLRGASVQNVKQTIPVQDVKQPAQIDDDFKQVHFAITIPFADKTRRTTVMLEGYLVSALQRKHGLADNTEIRAWIEQSVKDAGDKFDSNQATTKQVKRLIIESFV